MSQELQVVQCFSCETFQTQIVKKVKKWVCKICNEKQSLKKVYGQGSGKDCRMHCQRLNDSRGKKQEEYRNNTLSCKYETSSAVTELHTRHISVADNQNMSSQTGSSKWAKYLSQSSNSDPEEDECGEIRPSQFFLPKCTPESFDIPIAKKYKPDPSPIPSNSSEYFNDSEDDYFGVDLPDELEMVKNSADEVVNVPEEKTTVNEFSKMYSSMKNVPKTNFNFIVNDLMDEEVNQVNAFSKDHNILPQLIKESSKISAIPANSKSPRTTNVTAKSQSKMKDHAVFKIVPSDSYAVEQLKKRISLLEDIDKYTIDELTEICTFK